MHSRPTALLTEVNEIKRQIQFLCGKVLKLGRDESVKHQEITEIISARMEIIEKIWPELSAARGFESLQRHLACARTADFIAILTDDLPEIERSLENYILSTEEDLDLTTLPVKYLHPIIANSSFPHFNMRQYREAMLNGIIAIFDLIRKKSLEDGDGTRLCNHVFSLDRPILIFSDLDTEAGCNMQKGLINMINGIYIAMRNPAAHTLSGYYGQIRREDAVRYLMMLSAIIKYVDESKEGPYHAQKVAHLLIDKLDIAKYIEQHVKLVRRGNRFQGLCPFHDEKSPSFYVFQDQKNYHCFGCGAHGNIIDFVVNKENLSFADAVKKLVQLISDNRL